MSVLFGRKAESRAISYHDLWSQGKTIDLRGDKLSAALTLVPVYAATSLIADMVAASPWAAYVKDGDVTQKMDVQPQLITDPGVDGVDPFTWKHQAMTSALLRGNAYGLFWMLIRRVFRRRFVGCILMMLR
jgi:phage portal protein BeeE